MVAKETIMSFRARERILLRANDFIYLLPHPALREWISNYTVTFPNRNIISDCYTVIPHGSATLVFSCGKNGFQSNLYGPSTVPCMVGDRANWFDMLLIVEFQPAGLYAYTGIPQKELADRVIPFELVNRSQNSGVLRVLETAHTAESLVADLDKLFLAEMHPASTPALKLAAQMIIDKAGNVSQKELSNGLYYSQRHLNRIFDQYVGMNAKTFSRMVRINKAVHLLQTSGKSITYISDTAGYYDLPHFIHDFRAVCGISPQEYRNHMSDFYSEIAKF